MLIPLEYYIDYNTSLTFCEQHVQSVGRVLNELTSLFCWMTISATCHALFFFFPFPFFSSRPVGSSSRGSNRIDERAHCCRGSKTWDATPERHGCKDEYLKYPESKARVARVTRTNERTDERANEWTNDGRVLVRCGLVSRRKVSSGWRERAMM